MRGSAAHLAPQGTGSPGREPPAGALEVLFEPRHRLPRPPAGALNQGTGSPGQPVHWKYCLNERTVRELLARIAVRPLPKAARAQVAARPTRAEILAWAVDPHGRPTRGPHSHGLHVNVRWFGPDGHDCHEGECDVYNVDGLAYSMYNSIRSSWRARVSALNYRVEKRGSTVSTLFQVRNLYV